MTCLKSHSEINDRAKNWTFRLWSDDHYDWIYALLDHLAIQIWCRQACVPVELFTAHQIVLVSAGAVRQPRVQWIPYAVHSHLSSAVWVMACCTVVGKLAPAYEAVITTGTTLENHCATSKVLFARHHVPGHHGFPGCSRWQRGLVAGCAPESGLFSARGWWERRAAMMPGEWCFMLGCTSREGGTGDRTDCFAKPFVIADKPEYNKAKELQVPVSWSIWVCEKSYDYQQKVILQIWRDQQYGENLWKEMFPNICLQLFLRKVPTQPALLTEHWGERDFSYLEGGSCWLLTFRSQSIWGWKVRKTVLKFRMLSGRLPADDVSEKFIASVAQLNMYPLCLSCDLPWLFISILGHCKTVLGSSSARLRDLMKLVLSVLLNWCPGDRTVCSHGQPLM